MWVSQVNFFPLSEKCFWACLKCSLPSELDPHSIMKTIEVSGQYSLNVFSHTTLAVDKMQVFRKLMMQKKHRLGFIYQGKNMQAMLGQKPDVIFFPFFSLNPEQHNSFTGITNFYQQLSDFNHLPANVIKRPIFFVNKDNFSECADLDAFAYSLGTKVWIVPYSLFQDTDFDQEDYLYLRRLNAYKTLFIHPLHLEMIRKAIPQKETCYLLKSDITPTSLWQTAQSVWFYNQLFSNRSFPF